QPQFNHIALLRYCEAFIYAHPLSANTQYEIAVPPNISKAYRAATVALRLGATERLPRIFVKTPALNRAREQAAAATPKSLFDSGYVAFGAWYG
ncbi:MAG: hypothetical protein WBW33_07010, partial [Bryobacteraceae bacterium]